MMNLQPQFHIQRQFKGLLALIVTICLSLLTTTSVLAATVNISDQAGVLDQNKVRSAAQGLPYPINIYTVKNFTGTSSDFDQQARSHITSPNLIVIAIDTVHHHLTIVGGSKVPLSNSQYNEAINAFLSNYSSGGYTGATIAAINALRSALSSSSGNSTDQGSSNVSGFPPGSFGWLCCIGLLVLAALALLGGILGRRRGFFGRRPIGGPMNAPFQQPYNQGYHPDYYGQGYSSGNYGPGYPQRPGMNPWAAGGLGAAAGGLIGYELGKEQGEEQAREQGQNDGGDWNNGGGDFGGSNGGDFGGGGGGDFGGGGSGNF